MLGWLVEKSQNSRVYMCIKEVKWELEAGDQLRRAIILAMSQLFRNEMLEDSGFSFDVFDRPLDYQRTDLMRFYEMLEGIRNQNNMQIDMTKKNLQRFGMELPQFSIDHAKLTGRALEVWMCTLGAGIVPDRRDDVRLIWEYLANARGYIEDAIVSLRQVEERTAAATGINERMFAAINADDWVSLCSFIPSSFTKKLHIN